MIGNKGDRDPSQASRSNQSDAEPQRSNRVIFMVLSKKPMEERKMKKGWNAVTTLKRQMRYNNDQI